MIYADPSFLTSLYTWDANTKTAQQTYASNGRRPLVFTPWQRLEVRNAVRRRTAIGWRAVSNRAKVSHVYS